MLVALLGLLSVGAEGCDLRDMVIRLQDVLVRVAQTLGEHDARIDRLESCDCCCSGRFEPVCGDDGVTYVNECWAQCESVEIEHAGACDESACPGPNPQGCPATGCEMGEACVLEPGSCIPSACACDEASGLWVCTADCGGGICLGVGRCLEPNPAGCVQTGCPRGQECEVDPALCVPSYCECDGATGTWACTEDCGGGTCTEPSLCDGRLPSGCVQNGCPDGFRCADFAETGACVPSACFCDPETGTIGCTTDCNGGTCVPE